MNYKLYRIIKSNTPSQILPLDREMTIVYSKDNNGYN